MFKCAFCDYLVHLRQDHDVTGHWCQPWDIARPAVHTLGTIELHEVYTGRLLLQDIATSKHV